MIRPLDTTEKDDTTGTSVQSRNQFGKMLGTIATAVDATSGVLWAARGDSFRVLSISAGNDVDSRLLLSPAIEQQMLHQVMKATLPVLCHPEKSNAASAALLFGRLPTNESLIVGLTIPVERLRQGNLDDLQSEFVASLREVPTHFVNHQETDEGVIGPTSSRTKTAISIRELSQYLKTINGSNETNTVAACMANESRLLLHCDRVSVLIKKRGKFRLQAISGQHSINRRSQTVQLLENLADRILSAQRSFWYPDASDIPSQIGQVLSEYLSTSAVRNLVVIPLFSEEMAVEDATLQPVMRDPRSAIGGIVFEHFRERWDRVSVEPAISMLTEHCSVVLRRSIQHEQIFLLPLWKTLGNCSVLNASRKLSNVTVLAACFLLALLTICLWQVDFFVSANGILVPENYRPVFASADGCVNQIRFEHGDHVSQGDTLLTLSNPEHDLRVSEVESSLAAARQRLVILRDQRHKVRKDDLEKVEENIVSLKSQIESFEAQRDVLQKISDSMIVKSPLDGEIVTWDLHRKLENRVVNRGVQLLEVAQVSGKWLLEIELPIQRLGHIRRALQSRTAEELRVSFMLASDTRRRFTGNVVKIENSVTFNSSNQQVTKVWAAVDEGDVTLDQVRTGVTARIYCDQTSLGYLWFHGVSEFFTRKVLFPFL